MSSTGNKCNKSVTFSMINCIYHHNNYADVYLEWHSQGTGPILMSGVSCVGNESSIMDCPSDSTVLHDSCRHVNDVGVFCSTLESGK